MEFFALSKIFWALAAPSDVILWAGLTAVLLLLRKRHRAAAFTALFSLVLFIIAGVLPTYQLLLRPIEYRYANGPMPAQVDGIITLGGGLDNRIRLMMTDLLARQYPAARVIYSGGSGELLNPDPNGQIARVAKDYLLAMGVAPERLIIEDRSRNTWENILFSQRLAKPRPGENWVLATSAMQIPRAMEIANRLGWRLIPWATDYQSPPSGFSAFFDVPSNLWGFDNTIHEWLGIYVYRLTGRSSPSSEEN